MSRSPVTIAVVPRERFSYSIRSLESIYAQTPYPFDLVYVDGGSPRAVRDQLPEQAKRRGFRLLRTERHLSPNQALSHATGRYVVFIDNDVLAEPGRLDGLVTCAEETGDDRKDKRPLRGSRRKIRLVMRNLEHEWHGRDELRESA